MGHNLWQRANWSKFPRNSRFNERKAIIFLLFEELIKYENFLFPSKNSESPEIFFFHFQRAKKVSTKTGMSTKTGRCQQKANLRRFIKNQDIVMWICIFCQEIISIGSICQQKAYLRKFVKNSSVGIWIFIFFYQKLEKHITRGQEREYVWRSKKNCGLSLIIY